ncbi:hypothetical protein NM09_15655 [Vibrio caribbeanicus]|uniref:Uncharacterized protein n=1 Tax=Vibrio caribbeanicus TaxID=701175 RepID=A0ACC4NTU5_9VIBR|nr:hypothetical protein [Vibrio caribbeanicus]KHD23941.1 hypothetical protein NM09_15655 [Vibrio caribbeanicus]
MNYKLTPIVGALLVSGLTACGGGGGGGSDSASSDPDTRNPIGYLQSVNGQITDNSGDELTNVDVEVTVTDSTGSELIRSTTLTDDQGYYQLAIPSETTVDAHQVHISANKDNFVNAEKRITLTDEQISLTSDVMLSQVESISITRENLNNIAIGASGEQTLKLTLLKSSSGKNRLVTGDVVAAADEETQLSLSIPVSGIADSVDVVNGELAYFDSSNAQDIQSFPGEFRGYGETENQGQGVSYNLDSQPNDEYRLISSTFSQIKLTDQTGSPLPLSEVQSASGDSPSFTFKVPQGSYATLERDFDLTIDGIQIPIYVYRSGKGWQYVGNGLLVDGNDTPISDDYINDDNTLNLADYQGLLYVVVEITDANEWVQWINLDWPIITDELETVEVCLTGNLRYGSDESFDGSLNIRLPDGGYDWFYVNNGEISYSTTLTTASMSKSQLLEGTNWTVDVYNRKTNQYEQITLPETLSESECGVIDYSLFDPYQCEVKGIVFDSDGTSPLAWRSVIINHNSGREYTYTDENGEYQNKIPCSDVTVTALDIEQSGSVTEESSPLTINITRENQPPQVALARSSRVPVKLDKTENIAWYVNDPENDEVTLELSCQPADSCTIDESDNSASLSFTQPGFYTVTLTATDENENSTEKSLRFEVIPEDNQAPKIQGFEFKEQFFDVNATIPLIVNETGVLSVIAIDRNGDTLSYEWSGLSCSNSACEINDTLTQQATSEPLVLTASVSDNEVTTEADVKLVINEDLPPTAQLSLDNNVVGEINEHNDQPIRVHLSAQDDYTPVEQLQVTWSLVNDNQADVTNVLNLEPDTQTMSFTIAQGSLPIGDYQLSATIADTKLNGESEQVTVSKNLTVSEDLAPTIAITPSTTELHGTEQGANQGLTLTAVIADDNTPTDELIVTWATAPSVAFTTIGNQISFDSSVLLPGTFEVTATVTDGVQQSTSTTYQVVVDEDLPPVIQSMTATPTTQVKTPQGLNSQAITINVTAQDDFSEELSFEWSVSPSISFETQGSQLFIPANTVEMGQYTVTVRVTDALNPASTVSVNFSVTDQDGNIGIIIE